ncbi:MAG TPA: extracellular solute-binding protein [Candidatus Agrococcus pullicola]|uniref:Extracellular solute-binding protein n=1 Tax=Candidatus Agrococcus pullicola TaxID=2838429 RepID=A0A9D2CAN1_9MICO|nr:extracellular solute-binding protein [Candidatus Agrococcus pullicola]
MKNRKRTLLAGVAVGALALTGCGDAATDTTTNEGGDLVVGDQIIATAEAYEAAQGEAPITFYTGASEVSEQQVADLFAEETGLEVDIIRLPPNRLNERILSEQAAGQLGADVIRISGEDLIEGIADADVFVPVDLQDDISQGLFEEAVFEDGLYYSSYDRIYSFGYNNQVVDEADAPEDWADLLDPKWSGQSAIVQVGAGGSTAALTRFQIDVLGEDYLEEYAANNPRIFDSSAALNDALARGEVAVGTIPVATAYSAVLDGAPISIATPVEGAPAYPFYIGQTGSSSSPNAAEIFMNWMLATSAQEQAASMGDYPVRDGISNPSIGDIELPPADSEFVYRATIEESLDNLESDAELWTEIFGYTG